jgi:DNA-3-methyladenine glycosylase I
MAEPKRCWTPSDTMYAAYHDFEWGRPVVDERGLLERLCLEGFQSGLSWLTILRKREAFREAFHDFDPERVARFGKRDVARLLKDARIVRHRGKIEAAIANARGTLELRSTGTPLEEVIWAHRPERHRSPRKPDDWQATTPESVALSKALKKAGFVGPTTVYATMQECGIVNDHLVSCFVRAEVDREIATALPRLESAGARRSRPRRPRSAGA